MFPQTHNKIYIHNSLCMDEHVQAYTFWILNTHFPPTILQYVQLYTNMLSNSLVLSLEWFYMKRNDLVH